MSYSKRILFGDDPADDHVRERLAEATHHYLETFKFTLPARRRNRLGVGPYWDPFWPSSLSAAARELDIKTVQINSKLCTKIREECDSIRARAEAIHKEEIERYQTRVLPELRKDGQKA